MSKLIEVFELSQYNDFGDNLDIDKLQPIVDSVEELTIRNLLGKEFFFTVVAAPESFMDLLNETTFEYEGVTYVHSGLKAVIADFVMAKYIHQININIDRFGASQKASDPHSGVEPADPKQVQNLAGFHTETAYAKWEMVKYYLDKNKHLYPKWKVSTSTTSSDSSTGIKFSRIGKR